MKGRVSMVVVMLLAAVMLGSCASTYMSGSMKNEILINAPVDKVFDWVTDPANQAARLPAQQLSNVHGKGLGAGFNAYAKSEYGEGSNEMVVVGYIPNQLWVEKGVMGKEGVQTWTWIFIPQGSQTRIIKVGEITALVPAAVKSMGAEKIKDMISKAEDEELQRIKAAVERK